MGLLTRSEVMENVVDLAGASEDLPEAIVSVVTDALDSGLLVGFGRVLSTLPVSFAFSGFFLTYEIWYDFCVCERVEFRVRRAVRGVARAMSPVPIFAMTTWMIVDLAG